MLRKKKDRLQKPDFIFCHHRALRRRQFNEIKGRYSIVIADINKYIKY